MVLAWRSATTLLYGREAQILGMKYQTSHINTNSWWTLDLLRYMKSYLQMHFPTAAFLKCHPMWCVHLQSHLGQTYLSQATEQHSRTCLQTHLLKRSKHNVRVWVTGWGGECSFCKSISDKQELHESLFTSSCSILANFIWTWTDGSHPNVRRCEC